MIQKLVKMNSSTEIKMKDTISSSDVYPLSSTTLSHAGKWATEPPEDLEVASNMHTGHCWGTRLLPLVRTKTLIKGKSISMLLTPRCFSSCFRAVMCCQLRVVSIHFTSLRCLAQRSCSFRISKWELETSFTWPFLSCTQQTQLLYDYIFTQNREWEQFWTRFS